MPLHGVSCELDSQFTAVTGPSGSGKSSLLRVLAGLQRPDRGRVLIDGTPVELPTWSSAGDKRVVLVHQDYRLVDFLTVGENLRLAAELRSLRVDSAAVVSALTSVGLSRDLLDRSPGSLSGGEQQRTAIARALLCRASVLLADEPTGALDRDNTARVAGILHDIARRGDVRVVVATHDPLVAATATQTYRLSDGELSLDEGT